MKFIMLRNMQVGKDLVTRLIPTSNIMRIDIVKPSCVVRIVDACGETHTVDMNARDIHGMQETLQCAGNILTFNSSKK